MKLKKIASLMLAGVMAISMLAGCSNGNGGNDGENVVVPTGVVASVISKLDEDTTDRVTFTADAKMEDALEAYAKSLGDWATNSSSINATADTFKKLAGLQDANMTLSFSDLEDSETYVAIDTLGDSKAGYSEEAAAAEIAAAMDKLLATGNWYYEDYNDGKDYYTFEHTGKVAVVKVENVNGQSNYIYAFTVTRTPTKVSK
ncbi:hypothetical protein [Faecalibacterium sp. An192]|uniref:hypothetical protein n=1 Tax=Faecalibacterium sp. An192 TaxID=1965581 RepID=UPI000B55EA68|nr:hypothetical protein [Faecalibacterium sp. An192]OUP26743.1 hypothetical protein B5F27_12390 [Faecalibacterium sp. An192]